MQNKDIGFNCAFLSKQKMIRCSKILFLHVWTKLPDISKKKKKNHLTSQQPMTRERVSRCIFKCLCKEKRNPWEHEWPVGRTDLFKTSKLQAAQKQVPKKCQCPYLDNPPPSVCPGLWIRFTDPTSLCNQQSHRYNLFLIQHNKRMSLKHTLSTHPNNV